MAAPSILIPIDATWTSELAARTAIKTGSAYWKLEINEGSGYVDRTGLLADNRLTLKADNSILEPGGATTVTFTFRNSPKVFSEGALAKCPVRLSAKIGAASYIQIFQGYIDERGAARTKRRLVEDTVSFTAYDPTHFRAMLRKPPATAIAAFKICNTSAPATSIAHYLAGLLGLAVGDLDFMDLLYDKEYLVIDGSRTAWAELQDLAMHYGALLGFRYDGKLRLAVWTAAEWAAASPEYTFDDANVHRFTAVGADVVCNTAFTEWDTYEPAMAAGSIIYKNYDSWDPATKRNAIVVPAGQYWPGGTDDLALARLLYSNNDEQFPVGMDIITPTVGATGTGKDIEYSGGTIIIDSFNGSTSKTRRNPDSSELILRNTGGSPATITRLELRGTPLRFLKHMKVQHVDAAVSNEYDRVEREIPGLYATTVAMAKQIVRRHVDAGMGSALKYRAEVDFTPHLQAGALVRFNPTVDVDIVGTVDSFEHVSAGPHTGTRTTIEITKRISWNATGAGAPAEEAVTPNRRLAGSTVTIAPVGYRGFADVFVPPTPEEAAFTAINAEIDALSTAGGGVVRLVGGTFNAPAATAPYYIELKANVILELEAGVIVQGNTGSQWVIRCYGTGAAGGQIGGSGIRGTGKVTRTVYSNYRLIYVYWTNDFFIQDITVDGSHGGGIYLYKTWRSVVADVVGINGAFCQSRMGWDTKFDGLNFSGQPNYAQIPIWMDEEYGSPSVIDNVLANWDWAALSPYPAIRMDTCLAGIVARNTIRSMRGAAATGAWVAGIEVLDCSNLIVEENDISTLKAPNAPQYCAGIRIQEATAGTVKHDRLASNRIADVDGQAIVIEAGDGNTVEGNVAKDNGTRIDRGDCESTTAPMVSGETTPVLSNATFARQSGGQYGAYAYRATKTVASGTAAEVRLVDSDSVLDMHGLVAGARYTLHMGMKIPSGAILASEVNLWIEDYADGAWERTTGEPVATYGAWQNVEVTRTIRTGATAVRFGIELESAAASGEYIDVDDVHLMTLGIGVEHEQQFSDLATNETVTGNSWDIPASTPDPVPAPPLLDIEIENNDGIQTLPVVAGDADAFVTLPLAEENRGRRIRVMKADGGSGTVVVGTRGNLLRAGDCEPEAGWILNGDAELSKNLMQYADCEGILDPTVAGGIGKTTLSITVARSADFARAGTYSRKCTKNNTGAGYWDLEVTSTTDLHGFVPYQVVTFEAWVYIPAASGILGSEITLEIQDYVGGWGATAVACQNLYDQWQKVRVCRAIRASATGLLVRVGVASSASVSEYWYIDDVGLYGDFPRLRAAATPFVTSGNLLFDRPDGMAHIGVRSWKLTKNVAAGTEVALYLTENADTGDAHAFEFGTYTLEAWVYIPTASGISASEITLEIGDYTAAWEWTTQAAAATYDVWQKVTVTRTFRQNSTGKTARLRLASTAALNEYLYVDDVAMAGGSGPTLWGERQSANLNQNVTWERQSAVKYAGSYAMKFTRGSNAVDAWAYLQDTYETNQMHGFVRGRRYRLTAQIYIPSGGITAGEITIEAAFYGGYGSWVNFSVSPAATYDAWQMVTLEFTVPDAATGAIVRFRLASTATTGEYFYVDDVILSHAAVETVTVDVQPIGVAPHFELYLEDDWVDIWSDGSEWSVVDTNRPTVSYYSESAVSVGSALSTWYDVTDTYLSVPAGRWRIRYEVVVVGSAGATPSWIGVQSRLLPTGATDELRLRVFDRYPNAQAVATTYTTQAAEDVVTLTKPTRYQLQIYVYASGGTFSSLSTYGPWKATRLAAERIA